MYKLSDLYLQERFAKNYFEDGSTSYYLTFMGSGPVRNTYKQCKGASRQKNYQCLNE